ncbi:MAG: hypothetical protein M1816_005301 [Peltula sp. TS41687]|nr:MAG: hypothetical protein M1816_005301 [Peltula sp. TS41687]
MAPRKKTVAISKKATSAPAKMALTTPSRKPTTAASKKSAAAASKKSTAVASRKPAVPASKKTAVVGSQKRRADPEPVPAPKRRKTSPQGQASATQQVLKGKTAPKRASKKGAIINTPPGKRLNIYVFGANTGGELGLGPKATNASVKRPRLNPNLSIDSVGVVQVATGGMHCAALTHDNKILTWGVNDDGALGRDTKWEGGMRNVDDSDSDVEETPLNPRESTPTAIDSSAFPEGTVFTQLAASDSATFALTDEGLVYGWGAFRGSDGKPTFSAETKIQHRPILIPYLKKVTKIASGTNHAIALTSKGSVLSWGRGEQHELGRRIVERNKNNALVPREFGLSKGIVDIGSGSNHSFAVHENGTVYAWGSNNYGQTGIEAEAGEDNAAIIKPTVVDTLKGHGKITQIEGGNFHTVAVTDKGECLVFGRVDNHVLGVDPSTIPTDNAILDTQGRARIITHAIPVPGIEAAYAAAGIEHSLFVTKQGKVLSCGFSDSYRTGQGVDEDIRLATVIDNTAIRDKKIVWAGAGGQFSVLAGEDTPMVNGDN